METLKEKKKLLVKAELDPNYVFKEPTESYRFDIMYIGGVDPYDEPDFIKQFPLTPDECYKKEDN